MNPPTIAVDLRAALGTLTGIGVYTRALATELGQRSRIRILGVAHRAPDDPGWLAEAGIEWEEQSTPSGVLWQQLVLPRRLRRGDIDLFWSPLQTLPVLPAPVPLVTTVHDLTALLLPKTHRLKVRWSQIPFLKKSLDRARRIVAVSEATAEDLRRVFPDSRDRIRVVPNGVDPAFRPAAPEEIEGFRKDRDLPEGYLFYAGTLEPRKNVALLLDAWEILRAEEEHPLPLVLAGPYGWKSRRLARRLEELRPEGLRVLGHLPREDLIRWMQAARVFVYPSLYEGFGLPAAEAMACGVPVVATDAGSLPEVVDGAGILVSPEDSRALAEAIRRILDEPELGRDLGRRGRERAARFRWDRSAARLEELFLSILENGGPGS